MSYRDINDKATVSLFVNGEQAEDAMKRLKARAAELKEEIQKAEDANNPKEANKLRRELDRVTKEFNKTESAAKGTGIVLDNLSNSSIYGLKNALKYLQKELKMTKPDTQAWNDYAEQIKEVQARINELNGEFEEKRSLWDRFKDWSESAWPALDLLTQWGSSLVDIARGAVDAFAEMDQEMANVRKFTGMGAEGVAALNEEFKKMDTRTSRENLNKLAQEAGRLGKTSAEDVMGFVRAADKINVALDDLGEGATLTLSKLTGVFGYEQMYGTEQSLLKVGSVINELSQNCSASAPYLADFASRMGGVGAQAKMTIPQIMAFGAVLDANGQQVEASSTALSQVIVRMMQEPAKYAKVAGLDVAKFTKQLKTDVNGALIMFLETLQKAGGMDVLSPMFKDMGENGSRAISALSTLATHIDEVKAQQEAANVAFKEGTSIDKEFSVQNTTVQASLDKAKKAVNDLRVELGEKLSPVMSHIISSSTALIRVMMTVVRFMLDQKVTVMMLAVAMVTYYTAVNLAIIKTTAMTTATKAWGVLCKALPATMALVKVAMAALTNSVQYFTNGLRVNYAMQLRWRKAMDLMAAAGGAKIFMAITTAALALSQVLVRLIANHQAHVKALQTLNNIRQQAIGQVEEEKFKLQQLMEAASDVNATEEKRLEICNKLNETVPNMRANIDKLTGAFIYSKDAVDEYVKSLTHLYEIQGAKDKLKELGKKRADLTVRKTELEDERQKIVDEQSQYASNAAGNTGYTTTSSASMPSFALTMTGFSGAAERLDMNLKSVNRDLQELDEQSKLIYKTYGVLELMSDDPKQDFNPSVNENAGTGYTSQVQAEKDAKKAKATARAAAVQARKEFKEALDQIKAARDKEQTEIMALRIMGEINYLEYNKRKLAADQKYYDDSIALYKKWGIQEDDQCQALARKREEFLNKANQERLALNKEVIQRVAQAEERDLKARYESKSSHTLAEELQLEEELLKIRYNALMDQQSLYKKTDKEYEDYQRQIDDLLLIDQESKQKKLLAKILEFQKKYDYQPVKVKYDMERAALEELYRLKKIKEEDYRRWLKKLNDQEAEDLKKEKEDLPGTQKPQNNFTSASAVRVNHDKQKQDLDEALANGVINESEYQAALQRIGAEMRKALVEPLKESKSEWVSLMTVMMESWAELADALKDPDGDPLTAIGNAIQATAGVVTSVMSSITEFQKAEYEIQAAEVKKRYDAEIDAAQGNSYRTRKLEKEREKELAKLKKEQSKKQFALQVIATIAQTAANAVQAYSAGLSIGGPAGLIMAPIAAALAVAQGAVQIALIKKQQQTAEAQGYSKGGFTKPGAVDEPAGIVHAGEWVASQKLLANPVARPMIEALDYAQRTNTIGSLKDEDVSRSIRATDSMVRMAESDGSSALMVAVVAQNAQAVADLNERLRQPLGAIVTMTGDYGINNAKEKYDQYMRNKNPKSRR